jgi:hypothetical protein
LFAKVRRQKGGIEGTIGKERENLIDEAERVSRLDTDTKEVIKQGWLA